MTSEVPAIYDLLKSYADKGIEPPAAVAGLLDE